MVCALSISLGSTSFTKHFPGNTCYLTTYFWDYFLSQVTLLVSHPGFLAQHQSVFATGSISHAFHYFAFFTCKIIGIREKEAKDFSGFLLLLPGGKASSAPT